MPPAKKTATDPTPPDAPDAADDSTEATVDAADFAYGDYVRYTLEDGTQTHGMVLNVLDGDDDRDDALLVVPLPAAVTITADQLVDDDTDEG